jgi:hypothetical protein
LKIMVIVFLVAHLLCPPCPAQTKSGTVCVIPNSDKPPTRISPGGEYNPATLLLKIDQGPAIHWPHKEVVKIEALNLKERHLVVLFSDGNEYSRSGFDLMNLRTRTIYASLSMAIRG